MKKSILCIFIACILSGCDNGAKLLQELPNDYSNLRTYQGDSVIVVPLSEGKKTKGYYGPGIMITRVDTKNGFVFGKVTFFKNAGLTYNVKPGYFLLDTVKHHFYDGLASTTEAERIASEIQSERVVTD